MEHQYFSISKSSIFMENGFHFARVIIDQRVAILMYTQYRLIFYHSPIHSHL